MKHVFTVHSPVTFLVAYATMKELGLSADEVVFIASGYSIDGDGDGVRLEPSFQDRFGRRRDRLLRFNLPRSFDRYLRSLIGEEPFTAYVDLMSYYQRLLVTHEGCAAFHFIEEGNGSYKASDDLDDVTWLERRQPFRERGVDAKSLLRVLRGFNLRLLSMPYSYAAYAHFEGIRYFCLSPSAFELVPDEKKTVVRPASDDVNLLRWAGVAPLDGEVVWIDGSSAKQTGLPERYYEEAVDRAIPLLRERGVLKEQAWVKLRPGMPDDAETYLVQALRRHGVQVKRLPDQMIIECLLLASSRCSVVGALTSVLEYAHAFGHDAYSIYGLFPERAPTLFDDMPSYWRHVELLT